MARRNLDPRDLYGMTPDEINELNEVLAQLDDPHETCPGCPDCEH